MSLIWVCRHLAYGPKTPRPKGAPVKDRGEVHFSRLQLPLGPVQRESFGRVRLTDRPLYEGSCLPRLEKSTTP